jgi:hypothetical protein
MSTAFRVQPQYIQKAQLAWKLKSYGREQDIAQELGRALTLVIVNLFLKGKPVNRVNFIEICQLLGLNWREISGLDVQESPVFSHPVETVDEFKQEWDTVSQVSFEQRQCMPDSSLQTIRQLHPPIEINSGDALVKSSSGVEASAVEEAFDELASTLCEMLRRLTRKVGELLHADRTSIFLVDQERQELGSLIADDGNGGSLIIEMPLGRGIAGLAVTSLKIINIPFDLYDDPRSEQAKQTDKKTGYRTYTVLACPVLNKRKNLVAVVQLINKLKLTYDPKDDLWNKIDINGFTREDEAILTKYALSIIKILEKCQFCYQQIQKLKINAERNQANRIRPNANLIEKLKRQDEQLRKSLARI